MDDTMKSIVAINEVDDHFTADVVFDGMRPTFDRPVETKNKNHSLMLTASAPAFAEVVPSRNPVRQKQYIKCTIKGELLLERSIASRHCIIISFLNIHTELFPVTVSFSDEIY
jgi:hypothetical protein